MSELLDGMMEATTEIYGQTENGAKTLISSASELVDFFYTAPGARGSDVSQLFLKAFEESDVLAARTLLWLRDCRGGAGEREQFKTLFGELASLDMNLAELVLLKIPEIGRWDDTLVALKYASLRPTLKAMLQAGLQDESKMKLVAKWLPREKSARKKEAKQVAKLLGLDPKTYRKMLANTSETVEQLMCSKKWHKINFEQVPSLAMLRNRKAFAKHQENRFEKFLTKVKKGEASINSGQLFPYHITSQILSSSGSEREVLEEQWKALPDYCKDAEESTICVVDTSGSMEMWNFGTKEQSFTPMDIAISLGLYFAEKLKGPFKDHFITFSEKPSLQKVTGKTLYAKVAKMMRSEWGYNTNIQKTFDLILDTAQKKNLFQNDLPKKILIISDMQFDSCGGTTNYEKIKSKFEEAGYQTPDLVFWNVNGKKGACPVSIGDDNTALVGGFSPAIAESVLSGEVDPVKVFLKTVMKEKYNFVNKI